MTNNAIPRLCGGTFFTQLLLSRKPTVSRRQRTQCNTDVFHNEDVLFALLQLVHPDVIKPTGNSFETYTTNFKKCDGSIGEDLRFDNQSVCLSFSERLTSDYATVQTSAAAFCADYIDLGNTTRNHEKLVKRLIEIIHNDKSIADEELFQVGENGYRVNKKELPKLTKVSLPDFLLSVWAFVVLERKDNSIGRATILSWSDQETKGRYTGNDGSSITQKIEVTMPIARPIQDDIETCKDEPNEEYSEPIINEPTPESAPNVTNQLINVPAVFFNSGANVMQINNTGTINIDRGGKS